MRALALLCLVLAVGILIGRVTVAKEPKSA
jgi:hypothetical protein